ncbi:MAG: hypothetical protein KDB80_04885 [Planctomycetes bacterium]|nr:hypothetical protein [Planctomycetota bacterium]
MKLGSLASTVTLLLSTAVLTAQSQTGPWQAEQRATKVLYAGPGGSRETAFAEFLGAWFDTVETMSLDALTRQRAAPFDIVIADWTSQFGNDGYAEPATGRVPVTLDDDFTKPVIAMSYVAPRLRPNHKLEWL